MFSNLEVEELLNCEISQMTSSIYEILDAKVLSFQVHIQSTHKTYNFYDVETVPYPNEVTTVINMLLTKYTKRRHDSESPNKF